MFVMIKTALNLDSTFKNKVTTFGQNYSTAMAYIYIF